MINRELIPLLFHLYLGENSPYNEIKDNDDDDPKEEKESKEYLEYLLGTIQMLLCSCSIPRDNEDDFSNSPTQNEDNVPMSLSENELDLIQNNNFLSFIISDGINNVATAKIIVHLCYENSDISKTIVTIICSGIDLYDFERYDPFFNVLKHLVELKDSKTEERVNLALKRFVKTINKNLKFKKASFACIKFLSDTLPNEHVKNYLASSTETWAENWLQLEYDKARLMTEILIKKLGIKLE